MKANSEPEKRTEKLQEGEVTVAVRDAVQPEVGRIRLWLRLTEEFSAGLQNGYHNDEKFAGACFVASPP